MPNDQFRAHMLYVSTPGERPHFWLFEDFVWAGEAVPSFDTDGDAIPFDSTTWTELTIRTRDDRKERFGISPAQEEPLILKVFSDKQHLAARAAYALALYAGGGVSVSLDGPFNSPDVLIPQIGTVFDLFEALSRNGWLTHPPHKSSSE